MTIYFASPHVTDNGEAVPGGWLLTRSTSYIPYGEVFVEESSAGWQSPYYFNSKELDEETGLYYYGARYLNPTEARWLSVDPMWEKYAGMSPYNYCAGNPVKCVDPQGEYLRISYDDNGETKSYNYQIGKECSIKNPYLQNTIKTLNYLCNHEASENTILKIVNSNKRIIIRDTYRKNSYASSYVQGTSSGEFHSAIIDWNPNTGATIVDDNGIPYGTQSPSMLLNHELDRVSNAIDDYNLYIRYSIQGGDPDFDTISDKVTILGIESASAVYFGECVRKNHKVGDSFHTESPLSSIPNLSNDIGTLEKKYKLINISNQ